jgi:solute carrier family 13 (sodium-dependent dicarboxylate transporter), member 2/3/5
MNIRSLALSSIIHKKWYNIIFITLSLLILLIFYVIPTPEGLTNEGKIMIGILLSSALLWITEPIPLAATGLFIMVLQPLFYIMDAKEVFSSFGNQAIFFLIGAFIIAAAVETHGLHKRIALSFLKRFEKNPRILTFGIMLSCASMSFIMPEHGVAALFLPIITSILLAMKLIPKQSNFGKVSILAIAYGCSIGSIGTLIGGARNPLTIGFLSDYGIAITFDQWMLYSMPVVFICLPIVWIILQLVFPIEKLDISLAKQEIEKQVSIQGSFSKQETFVLFTLLITIFLWVFFSNNTYFGLAGIALLGSVILFITGTITWKDIEKKVPWGIILLYGGAITLGIGMQKTQAGTWVAQKIFESSAGNPFIIIFAIILFTMILTNVMSNTGAVAVLLPIGMAIANQIPFISPTLSSMLIALSGGLAFVFIIATPGNAITYSAGYFSTKDLFKAGIIANILCLFIIFAIAIIYWKGILGI